MTKRLLALAILAGFCLSLQPPPARADGAQSDSTRKILPHELEFLEDGPLPPALPVPGAGPAPHPTFQHYQSVQVNVGPGGSNIPGDAANEPSIAIDPTHPLNMAIVWRQFNNVSSNFRQAGFGYTTDEGRTWTFPGVLTPGTFRSDPVLTFDRAGNFYWNSLKEDFTTDVFKSSNGGANWGAAVPAWGGDKQWMECDRTTGIGSGNLYSDWTANTNDFTRSTDGGQSFGYPTTVPSHPQWGTIAVSPQGVVWLVGIDGNGNYVVSHSANAQDPQNPTPTWTTQQIDLGGFVNGWAGPNPGGLLGQAWIAVDPSTGPTAGWIYVAASVDPPTVDPLDVHFIRSTNGGQSWSAPIKLNDDTGTSAWQWFGTMSVSPNGRIDVIWNDTRNTGQANKSQLFYTSSTDGGTTWTPNQQLSPTWDSYVGWPNQNKIGDYYHMHSDLVGADLAWAATFNNEQDVYYLRIGDHDCNGNGVPDSLDIANGTSPDQNGNGIPDECEGPVTSVAQLPAGLHPITNTPNPFRESTVIRYELPGQGGAARISIYNAGGQLVRTLRDEEARGGVNTVAWDGSDDHGRALPAGVYLYRLEAAGIRSVQRTLLLR